MRKDAGLGAYMRLLAAAAGLALACDGVAAAPVANTAEAYVAAAAATAGEEYKGILSLCAPGAGFTAINPAGSPAKVFDNLYFLGIPSVSAWALTTSAGIILIDTLDDAQEAQTYIEGGLRKLKLDPAQIKYIVITHAHFDHFGGAQYLANKFHPTVIMSNLDWDELGKSPPGSVPKRGRGVNDGDTLTLGDTTIEFYVTPPHTPGTLSLILPLKDGEMRHVGAEWGGTGFNFEQTRENFSTYIASAQRFSKVAHDEGVDVPLSNHSTFDDAFNKIARLKGRNAGDPHPFVMGEGSEEKFLAVAAECAMAERAKLRSAR